MSKPKILVQLDTDPQPSVFDARRGDRRRRRPPAAPRRRQSREVRDLVYGAMFTRGVDDLRSHGHLRRRLGRGGRAKRLLAQCCGTFFGPMRVSVMLDSNGANTTAAAAVLAAGKHLPLDRTRRPWCWRPPGRSARAWCGCWRSREPTSAWLRAAVERAEAVCRGRAEPSRRSNACTPSKSNSPIRRPRRLARAQIASSRPARRASSWLRPKPAQAATGPGSGHRSERRAAGWAWRHRSHRQRQPARRG